MQSLSSSLGEYLFVLSPTARRGVIDNLFQRVSFSTFCGVIAKLIPEQNRRLFEGFFQPSSGLEPPELATYLTGADAARIRFLNRVCVVRTVQMEPLSWASCVTYMIHDAHPASHKPRPHLSDEDVAQEKVRVGSTEIIILNEFRTVYELYRQGSKPPSRSSADIALSEELDNFGIVLSSLGSNINLQAFDA